MERRSRLGITGGHRSGQGLAGRCRSLRLRALGKGRASAAGEGGGAVCILELLDPSARRAAALSAGAEQEADRARDSGVSCLCVFDVP